MADNGITVEQAGWLVGKILLAASTIGGGVLVLIRLVNKPMQNDIDEIKRRLGLEEEVADKHAATSSREIAEIRSDIRNINTRLDAHFSEDAEQARAARAAKEQVRALLDLGILHARDRRED